MGSLYIAQHPLIQNKLSMLRNESTGNKEFRELVEEIAMLLFYEATSEEPIAEVKIQTPLGTASGKMLDNRKYAIVPILRAGIGMADGVLRLMPTAKVGHIGLYRDPDTLLPVEYYCKLPQDIAEREVFLLDPMLATGGSSSAAVQFLKDRGAKSIRILCLISSPEGVARLGQDHDDVSIYTAANDECLNEHGYILPGLGDAGDRLYGTK